MSRRGGDDNRFEEEYNPFGEMGERGEEDELTETGAGVRARMPETGETGETDEGLSVRMPETGEDEGLYDVKPDGIWARIKASDREARDWFKKIGKNQEGTEAAESLLRADMPRTDEDSTAVEKNLKQVSSSLDESRAGKPLRDRVKGLYNIVVHKNRLSKITSSMEAQNKKENKMDRKYLSAMKTLEAKIQEGKKLTDEERRDLVQYRKVTALYNSNDFEIRKARTRLAEIWNANHPSKIEKIANEITKAIKGVHIKSPETPQWVRDAGKWCGEMIDAAKKVDWSIDTAKLGKKMSALFESEQSKQMKELTGVVRQLSHEVANLKGQLSDAGLTTPQMTLSREKFKSAPVEPKKAGPEVPQPPKVGPPKLKQ